MALPFLQFKIFEHRRFGIDRKAVALHVTKRNKVKRHRPAMQIAVYIKGGEREFACLNIVIGIGTNAPFIGEVQVSP